ncbi:MAG: hypothetical protein IJS61_07320 [Firmicutes bacterium]|nr:hypothetical protein [Bacillota bacterium]
MNQGVSLKVVLAVAIVALLLGAGIYAAGVASGKRNAPQAPATAEASANAVKDEKQEDKQENTEKENKEEEKQEKTEDKKEDKESTSEDDAATTEIKEFTYEWKNNNSWEDKIDDEKYNISQYYIDITNTSEEEIPAQWTARVTFDSPFKMKGIWNGKHEIEDNVLIYTADEWTQIPSKDKDNNTYQLTFQIGYKGDDAPKVTDIKMFKNEKTED